MSEISLFIAMLKMSVLANHGSADGSEVGGEILVLITRNNVRVYPTRPALQLVTRTTALKAGVRGLVSDTKAATMKDQSKHTRPKRQMYQYNEAIYLLRCQRLAPLAQCRDTGIWLSHDPRQ